MRRTQTRETLSTTRWPAVCTIISRNYLSHARVLAESFLEYHPGAHFYALVVDGLPAGTQAGSGIHVIDISELDLPYVSKLYFNYDVIELCTALKPTLLKALLRKYEEEAVLYLDPDILVTRPLTEAADSLASEDIVLTPHLLHPIPDDGLIPGEREILTAGSYNLGFIGVRNSPRVFEFLRWWEQRLSDGCIVEPESGMMTDQRWVDLAPGIFSAAILRDETYNVAYWNLHSRHLEQKPAGFEVNGRPLAFFHFSGFDPARPYMLSKYQNRTSVGTSAALSNLVETYRQKQMRHGFEETHVWQYAYGSFDNGVAIHRFFRRIFSSLDDQQRAAFGDPFRSAGGNSFFAWATRRDPTTGLSPFLAKVVSARGDVRAAFPQPAGRDRKGFLEWARTTGAREFGYDPVVADSWDAEMVHAEGGPRCSIIIPVYNKPSLTRACIHTLLSDPTVNSDCEIIVADDASTDLTGEVLKSYGDRIRIVRHEVNQGFARTCNDAAAVATAEYLVFLNNDTVPQSGWLDALVRYADAHPNAAVVGSKLLFPNDTIQHAGVVICEDGLPRHVYAGFPADHPAVNRSRRFQIVTGASFLIRRQDFERAAGFDPIYRNGSEDVDLCLRLGEMGREVHYCHESVLYHLESASRWEFHPRDDPWNGQIYMKRWMPRVRRDEFSYYVEDGLLKIEYPACWPIRVSASPSLATVKAIEPEIDRVLQTRSRQVFGLLKDNIRLNLRVKEAELSSDLRARPRNGYEGHPLAPPRLIARGQCQWLSKESSGRIVSIILPVKNGAAKLRQLLPALMKQKCRDAMEVVAVDSASTDDSVELLLNANATVVSIDPRSFNHGLTRNLATSYASGDIYVFVNQSTTPADEFWLANLIAPFNRDARLAGVYSRILPRKDADLLVSREVIGNINASTERIVTQIADWDSYRSLTPDRLRCFVNFHTMSGAIRADVFRQIPFRPTDFGEDLIWGKEALEAGYRIQFEPSSVAFHSHNYSLLDILRRNFDDGVICQKTVGRSLADENVAPDILHIIREDWRHLENHCRLQGAELEEWRLLAGARRTAQVIGQWLGVNYTAEDGLLRLLSITEQIKSGSKTELPELWRVADAHNAG